MQAGGEAFVRIEPAASREQYKWMERFVAGVTDEPLRERLVIAIDGKGAFRRFKDVLLNYPTERERWFSYRSELLHWAMQKWLEKEQLAPKEPAPWGAPKPPPEDNVQLERPAAGGEGPGEILRRQAKELIDLVPGGRAAGGDRLPRLLARARRRRARPGAHDPGQAHGCVTEKSTGRSRDQEDRNS